MGNAGSITLVIAAKQKQKKNNTKLVCIGTFEVVCIIIYMTMYKFIF